MQLIKSHDNDCLAAAIAMVAGSNIEQVKRELYPDTPVYPFPAPWDKCPLVPSMELVCDWMVSQRGIALTPFPYAPVCSPEVGCPTVDVWDDADAAFEQQLTYGKGLLEGLVRDRGHMCAWWNGLGLVYDPRGYIYSYNACDRFNFIPTRFWLATC